MGKGGPRRAKVPEIDQEHLVDTFLSHVRKVGEAAAFNLGEYKHLDAAQGVKGSALADQLPLLQMLHKVSPTLVFKYSQVKEAFRSVFRQHPGVRDKFPATEQVKLDETLAEAILVLCNHARRIGRDQQKFREACSRLVNFQVEKLETMRSMLAGDVTTPEKPKRKKEEKQATPSPASSHGIGSVLDQFTIPPTQEEESSEEADALLASARKAPPIPVRKAILKAEVAAKKPAAKGFKKPAAAGSKKASGISDSFKVEGQKLTLMHYKATGSWAVRIVGGKQLLQVKSKKGSQQSKKWAEHLKKKLEEGWDLGQAKAWKAQQLARD